MKKKPLDQPSEQAQDQPRPASADNTPADHPVQTDDEHTHGNYLFALKVLAVLAAIILIIIILKVSGVPIGIKNWFADCIRSVYAVSAGMPCLLRLF